MSNIRILPVLRSTLGTLFTILILGISSQVVHIEDAEARRGGGGHSAPSHGGRGASRTGRRTVRRDNYRDRHDHHHRPRIGAAIATGIVVGSIIASLPRNCSRFYINGITYHQCGNVYYQPYYRGTSVTYVVINSPY